MVRKGILELPIGNSIACQYYCSIVNRRLIQPIAYYAQLCREHPQSAFARGGIGEKVIYVRERGEWCGGSRIINDRQF